MARPRLPKRIRQAILDAFNKDPRLTYPQIAAITPLYRIKSTGKSRRVSPPTVIKVLKQAGVWTPRKEVKK